MLNAKNPRLLIAGIVFLAGVAAWPALHLSAPLSHTVPELQVSAGTNATSPKVTIAPLPAQSAQPGTPLPLEVIGRHSMKDGVIWHEWPGFTAKASFSGDQITLWLDDAENRLRLIFDNGQTGTVELSRPGRAQIAISGLGAGPHQLSVETRSESHGPAQIMAAFAQQDGQAAPAARVIEFIGDSDTVGYGNTAPQRECSADQRFANTDTSQSFGPQIARAFGADYRMIAKSGIGLLRNYGGANPDQTMTQLYPAALPSDPKAAPAPARAADLIVIGLGGNDFGSDFQASEPWQDHSALETDFTPALTQFALARHRENPDAAMILLGFGEYGPELRQAYATAAETLTQNGIPTGLVILPDLQRSACDWHPSAKDHEVIAAMLTQQIGAILPQWRP